MLPKSSERLTHRAGLALATSGPFKEWLVVVVAEASLKAVAAKENSRALKRKAEAQLAAEQRGSLECFGRCPRAATRASIAGRPVKTHRIGDRFGNSHVF